MLFRTETTASRSETGLLIPSDFINYRSASRTGDRRLDYNHLRNPIYPRSVFPNKEETCR